MDSGNTYRTAISRQFMKKIGLTESDLMPVKAKVKTAAEGSTVRALGETKKPLTLQFEGCDKIFQVRPVVLENLSMDLNISGPFLRRNGIDQIHSKDALLIDGQLIPLTAPKIKGIDAVTAPVVPQDEDHDESFIQDEALCSLETYVNKHMHQKRENTVYTRQKATLQPGEYTRVFLYAPGLSAASGDAFLEPSECIADLHPDLVLPEQAVVTIDEGKCAIVIANEGFDPITLHKDTCMASLHHLGEVEEQQRTGEEEEHQAICALSKDNLERQNEPKESDSWTIEQKKEWLRKEFKLDTAHYLKDDPRKQELVLGMLVKHWPVFSVHGEFGKTDLIQHEIITENVPPIKDKVRPINPNLEPQLREQLDEWLKHGVIEPSNSPWNFALFSVPKKQPGKFRWVIDLRKLNKITKKDRFPIPNIEDNLARLSRSKYFSAIDGAGAYHVVDIAKKDRQKTSFTTPWGTWQFKKLCFGLCNAPSTYSRLVQQVLKDVPYSVALPYLDDTACHSKTFEEHVDALDLVLERFEKAGLKLQPSKCQLFSNSIEYLGHLVGPDGISPVPKYLKVVKEWPEPKSPLDVASWLGKTGYYRRFVKDYGKLVRPLQLLTTDEAKESFQNGTWKFTQEARKVFNHLKERLTTAPVLAYPRFDSNEPFIVDTDWSRDSNTVGGVLSQKQDGVERVICYGARKLPNAAKNYAPTKGEMAAVIIFLRMWKYYLQGRRFILRTDHAALQWMENAKEPAGMVPRWQQILSEYQYDVQYRPGRKHNNADALSRIAHADHLGEDEQPDDIPAICSIVYEGSASDEGDDVWQEEEAKEEDQWIASMNGHLLPLSVSELRALQREDADLSQVFMWLKKKQRPDGLEARRLSVRGQLYAGLYDSLRINEDGLVCVRMPGSDGKPVSKVCIPEAAQEQVIMATHRLGAHQALEKTTQRVQRNMFIPDLKLVAKEVLADCSDCLQAERGQKPQRGLLVSPQVGYPFQKICIDFMGPLEVSSHGNRYILTVQDAFSRWIEAFPMKTANAREAMDILAREIFYRYGFPEIIHSDRGAQFLSHIFAEVCAELNIKQTVTPAYNPKSNMVERQHKEIGAMLRKFVGNQGYLWEDYLPQTLYALRTAINSTTGVSPYKIVFAHESSQPLDYLFGKPEEEDISNLPARQYARKIAERAAKIHQFVRHNISSAVARQRRRYHEQYRSFQIGAKVWLYTPAIKPGTSKKLSTMWTGPWTITKKINALMYEIAPDPSWPNQKRQVVALDRLRLHTRADISRPPTEEHDIVMADDPLATSVSLSAEPDTLDDMAKAISGAGPSAPLRMSVGGGGGGGGGAAAAPPPQPGVVTRAQARLQQQVGGPTLPRPGEEQEEEEVAHFTHAMPSARLQELVERPTPDIFRPGTRLSQETQQTNVVPWHHISDVTEEDRRRLGIPLEPRPEPESREEERRRLGLLPEDLTEEERRRFGLGTNVIPRDQTDDMGYQQEESTTRARRDSDVSESHDEFQDAVDWDTLQPLSRRQADHESSSGLAGGDRAADGSAVQPAAEQGPAGGVSPPRRVIPAPEFRPDEDSDDEGRDDDDTYRDPSYHPNGSDHDDDDDDDDARPRPPRGGVRVRAVVRGRPRGRPRLTRGKGGRGRPKGRRMTLVLAHPGPERGQEQDSTPEPIVELPESSADEDVAQQPPPVGDQQPALEREEAMAVDAEERPALPGPEEQPALEQDRREAVTADLPPALPEPPAEPLPDEDTPMAVEAEVRPPLEQPPVRLALPAPPVTAVVPSPSRRVQRRGRSLHRSSPVEHRPVTRSQTASEGRTIQAALQQLSATATWLGPAADVPMPNVLRPAIQTPPRPALETSARPALPAPQPETQLALPPLQAPPNIQALQAPPERLALPAPQGGTAVVPIPAVLRRPITVDVPRPSILGPATPAATTTATSTGASARRTTPASIQVRRDLFGAATASTSRSGAGVESSASARTSGSESVRARSTPRKRASSPTTAQLARPPPSPAKQLKPSARRPAPRRPPTPAVKGKPPAESPCPSSSDSDEGAGGTAVPRDGQSSKPPLKPGSASRSTKAAASVRPSTDQACPKDSDPSVPSGSCSATWPATTGTPSMRSSDSTRGTSTSEWPGDSSATQSDGSSKRPDDASGRPDAV